MSATDTFQFSPALVRQLYGRRIFQIKPPLVWHHTEGGTPKLTLVVGAAEWADPALKTLLQNILGPKALNVPEANIIRAEANAAFDIALLENTQTEVALVIGLQWLSLPSNPFTLGKMQVYQVPDLHTLNANREAKAAAWGLMQQFKPQVTA